MCESSVILKCYVAAAEFVRLTEALEVLLDTAARVCTVYFEFFPAAVTRLVHVILTR